MSKCECFGSNEAIGFEISEIMESHMREIYPRAKQLFPFTILSFLLPRGQLRQAAIVRIAHRLAKTIHTDGEMISLVFVRHEECIAGDDAANPTYGQSPKTPQDDIATPTLYETRRFAL